MTTPESTTKCPRCGESASGKFCPACGAALTSAPCASCSKPLTPGARFCHHCGAAAGSAASGRSAGAPPAWMIAASVIVVLIAFVAGQQFGSRGAAEPPGAPEGNAAAAPFAGGGGRAPDISRMTPEEAATRLYDRVMRYASEGKKDSAAMFAPMAIMAYERIGPPDMHTRYDIGAISAAIDDAPAAAAEADTILKSNPNHLLGLLLAAKAADLRKDPAGASKFRARMSAAAQAELAKGLKEYGEHKGEIDDALAKKSR